ncbi:WD40/YVTN/BNR-like repeat-containing protein [Neolewinella agarilytica]|uniref:Sortilin, neurotensin receptor 3 n=1 Tax=Neolewinella agarilytica TaxID=478744 RepID=A0A1H9AFM4_9BACT|nr:hypothetical protein [Neolewinella agarilytica]SEP75526.1 Sortilin, neurotensin receptor 3 [Neolewinella agarilytica]
MKKAIVLLLFCLLTVAELPAQIKLDHLEYRNLGPTRGGRATAVAGVRTQPNVYYMGATGGGVWKTEDYGTSWTNVSDGFFDTPSIGAIRVAQNDPNIVYVGTGSDGLRSNVIAGKGVYKSVDAGKSWKHIGLKNAGQIGAVEIHPTNHNIAFVAAIGNAFAPNPERGVFRTKDGGKSWEKVLFISEQTGAADLEFMPSNPDIIYATVWRAERKPWTIISGGEEHGIYKSVDGGDNWTKLEEGLPSGIVGKIDLAVSPANPSLLYALIEAPNDKGGLYRSNDQGESFIHVSNDKNLSIRPFYYTNLDVDPQDTDILYVLSTPYLKSTDGGEKWERLNPPHGDNHDMWINPDNPRLFIQANDGGANVTHNGGETWSTQLNQPTAELYTLEVDDQYPYWLYAGQQDNYTTISVPSLPPYSHQAGAIGLVMNTGGCETGPAVPKPGNPDIVYSNCKGRFSVYNKTTGQEQSYDVGAAFMYGHNPKELKFRFQRVSPIHVSPHDPEVIYHTSQFVHKTTDEGKTWEIISPDLTAFEDDKQVISGSPITRDITGEEFYSTIYAIRESAVEKGLIWVGANDGPVHLTRDGGANWKNVTPADLPGGGRIDCVEPSPHQAGKAYFTSMRYQLGDWKPYIYKTTNYGKSWELLTSGENGIPADHPVRVVREDPDREGLLYAGTEFGLFISFDDGINWQSFQRNLPVTPISDIKVHRKDLVLATMGRSFWVMDNLSSLHQGAEQLAASSPARLFRPRDQVRYRYRGRSGSEHVDYLLPGMDIDYYLPEGVTEPLKLEFLNATGKVVRTLVSDNKDGEPAKVVRDMATNDVAYNLNSSLSTEPGLHRFSWDMRHHGSWDASERRRYAGGPMVSPGTYTVRLTVGDKTMEESFALQLDPKVAASGVSLADVQQQESVALDIIALLSELKKMAHEIEEKLEALKAKETLTATEQKQLAQLQQLHEQLVTAKGTYQKPMLISQVSYLYGIVRRADQLPGRDVFERLEVLKGEKVKLSERGD